MSKIQITGPVVLNEMKAAVESEIAAFEEFFTRSLSDDGVGNSDPLLPSEKALLRTYLAARLSGKFSPP